MSWIGEALKLNLHFKVWKSLQKREMDSQATMKLCMFCAYSHRSHGRMLHISHIDLSVDKPPQTVSVAV